MAYGKFRPSGPAVHAKIESPFDFSALDRALVTVLKNRVYLGCGHGGVKLAVLLPSGSKARKWLLDHDSDRVGLAAAGTMTTRVKKLRIATERGIPLSHSAILPLAGWIIKVFMTRTSKPRKICLMPWVIVNPSQRAVFEKRIREATGEDDVEVDFFGWS
jgi:hypothetical protein